MIPAGERWPARLAVVHGPGLDLGRRGLETPAPGSLEALEGLLDAWVDGLPAEVTSVAPGGEHGFLEAVEEAAAGGVDGLVLAAGDLAFESAALGTAVASAIAAGSCVVDLHLPDLRRRGLEPAASLLAAAGARTIHGRGIEGYRWALAHLAWRCAWPPVVEPYGAGAGQVGDLRVPAGPGPHPAALLLHGGFWLEPWERDLLDGLAVDLARRGWATYNVEYRRVGGGGGWPATFEDVQAAFAHVEALAGRWGLDTGAVLAVGHSAGGHLALRLAAEAPVQAVLGLAPLADLAAAREQGLGGGAVEQFLAGAPLVEASPLTHLPLGVGQLLAHCADDTLVPVSQSEGWAATARAAGDPVTLLTLPSGGHFALVTPGTSAWQSAAALLDPAR